MGGIFLEITFKEFHLNLLINELSKTRNGDLSKYTFKIRTRFLKGNQDDIRDYLYGPFIKHLVDEEPLILYFQDYELEAIESELKKYIANQFLDKSVKLLEIQILNDFDEIINSEESIGSTLLNYFDPIINSEEGIGSTLPEMEVINTSVEKLGAVRNSSDYFDVLEKDQEFKFFEVLFGTNRQINNSSDIDNFFSNDHEDIIKIGSCIVSIPNRHKDGRIERPNFFERLFGLEKPNKHMMLHQITLDKIDLFLDKISDDTEGLLFIHGFNVDFKDALLRSAQLGNDLKCKGNIFSFIWPSKANVKDYIADLSEAEYSSKQLKEFIEIIISSNKIKKLNIIAHSMGNVVLTQALDILKGENKYPLPLIEHLILAAPDIDQDFFKTQILPWIKTAKLPNVTLYVSKYDMPLEISSKLRSNYKRLGQGGSSIFLNENIETIDASSIYHAIWNMNHGYFSSDPSLLSDIFWLLSGKTASERRLNELRKNGIIYWSLPNTNYINL